ncbi:MAG TPA: methyltransferase, partial [Terriglobia bacterium]|nr:methyltransferase [Terriglobia bacterium]
MLPLRFGSPEQFALVKGFLEESFYAEEGICNRLGLSALHEYAKARERAPESLQEQDRLNLLIRVFFCGEQVSREQLQKLIPDAARGAFENLGLLGEDQKGDGRIGSPAALYPAHGLYFVSDHWTRVDRPAAESLDDIVFPAISRHTYQFLETLPQDPCESFLDLCSGTAVAALVAASRYARHAWAVDITERATQCGEFNRRLNGIDNATVLQGNLYAPLEEIAFERIVAHPPYVPVMQPSKIYYDGGEDGERVTRGIV